MTDRPPSPKPPDIPPPPMEHGAPGPCEQAFDLGFAAIALGVFCWYVASMTLMFLEGCR